MPDATVIPVLHYPDVRVAVEWLSRAFGFRERLDVDLGERQCTAVDPGGHVWTFSQTVADIDPGTWGGVLVE